MPVTRPDLISRLASLAAISTRDAKLVKTTVLKVIEQGLARGQRTELQGFGVFQRRELTLLMDC